MIIINLHSTDSLLGTPSLMQRFCNESSLHAGYIVQLYLGHVSKGLLEEHDYFYHFYFYSQLTGRPVQDNGLKWSQPDGDSG